MITLIRIRQVEVDIKNNSLDEIKRSVALKLNINKNDITNLKIKKESIDARKKLKYIYEVDIDTNKKVKFTNDIFETPNEEYRYTITGTKELQNPIVIVGSGPAGLFASYMLSLEGYPIILIERGEKVEDRIKSVDDFWNNNILNTNSNIQFGEGGAGTFSDGKLNTLKKDKEFRQKKVFEIFKENGANEDILYSNKPHIGTDILRNVIKNMRDVIIKNGGIIKYNTTLNDLIIENNKIVGCIINDEEIKTDNIILAIGNAARDTFRMLYKKGVKITTKPFAIGIRIQHPQKMIDLSQYKTLEYNLPPSSYKLTYQAKDKRGVYTFCMCPGGYVINASSENNRLVINGMSNNKRDSENANSAIIVTISSKDFGENPLSGIDFQEHLEQTTYKIGDGLIPIQTYKGFKENKIIELGYINPIFKGKYKLANINDILPDYISKDLKEAIEYFGTKIKGFNDDDAIIAAIESRTSSPIRIERDDNMESNIKGLYPIGEGSGYAGGITTSAMDGLKIFEEIIKKYKKK